MNRYQVLCLISAIFVIFFIVFTGIDWISYDPALTSFPFRAFVLTRALEFLIPAALLFLIARLTRKP